MIRWRRDDSRRFYRRNRLRRKGKRRTRGEEKRQSDKHRNLISEYYVSITLRSSERKRGKNLSRRFTGMKGLTRRALYSMERIRWRATAPLNPVHAEIHRYTGDAVILPFFPTASSFFFSLLYLFFSSFTLYSFCHVLSSLRSIQSGDDCADAPYKASHNLSARLTVTGKNERKIGARRAGCRRQRYSSGTICLVAKRARKLDRPASRTYLPLVPLSRSLFLFLLFYVYHVYKMYIYMYIKYVDV